MDFSAWILAHIKIDYRCNLSEISLLYCENFGEFGNGLIFVGFARADG